MLLFTVHILFISWCLSGRYVYIIASHRFQHILVAFRSKRHRREATPHELMHRTFVSFDGCNGTFLYQHRQLVPNKCGQMYSPNVTSHTDRRKEIPSKIRAIL